MSLKRAGHAAMNALVAAPAKKMRPRARTKFPPGLFGLRHGGAEKKFNRTGGTAGKTLAGGLVLRETVTRIRYRRIESRAVSAGRSHQAGGLSSSQPVSRIGRCPAVATVVGAGLRPARAARSKIARTRNRSSTAVLVLVLFCPPTGHMDTRKTVSVNVHHDNEQKSGNRIQRHEQNAAISPAPAP
jgi:hypothetical protein